MDPRISTKMDTIRQKVRAYHPDPDMDKLNKAFELAVKMHAPQKRKNGDPYILHPLEVTSLIADLKLDIAGLCAGLLHDVVEDTDTTVDDLEEMFGRDVAFIVNGVTKLSKLECLTKQERQAESWRKMFLAMAADIRVILVKLADRVHNMRTLRHMKPHKQREIAQETLDIYAPLANRLGVQWIKSELEDESFRYLHPDDYYALAEAVDKRRDERERYIRDTQELLQEKLTAHNITAKVYGRPKHFYSIWKKMQSKGIAFDQVYDVLAFRVLPDTMHKCYEVLGVVHSLWRPVPGRFKDYIGMPKPNGYQSLHTSVIGPSGERVEIQIRTPDMHKVAEEGVAAHWQYKEGGKVVPSNDAEKFAWLRQLIDWQQDLADPKEFLDMVKVDMFSDEVYTLTPEGHIKVLPAGATPIDFAYTVHTEVGNRCVGAKVNNQIVSLKTVLTNGDTVEILTKPGQTPNPDWLKFAKTGRARTKIRQYVRSEQRERSRDYGRELLEKELRRHDMSLRRIEKDGRLQKAAEACKCQNTDELIINLGYGKLQVDTVIRKLVADQAEPETKPGVVEEDQGALGKVMRFLRGNTRRKNRRSGIAIDGVEDIMLHFARCCSPVRGEDVVGYITRGRGMSVHAADCAKLKNLEPERLIDVHWENDSDAQRPVTIRVHTNNATGMLASLSQAFTGAGINITQAHCRATNGDRAINTFEVMVSDSDQLTSVMRTIRKIPGVQSAERVRV